MSPDDPVSLTALPVAWQPSPEYLERSRLLKFMRAQGHSDYAGFLRWSVAEPAAFWDAVMQDLDLRFYEPYTQTLDSSRGLPWTTWFRGGRYNYVHNAVDKWADSPTRDEVAVVWEGDDGATEQLTWAELAIEVGRLAAGLRRLGLRKGDRVGIFMPMTPATVTATLAVNKLGAVYVPIFSGYGAEAVTSRLQDSEARFLLTADGCLRRGKVVPMKETADAAAALSPTVERVVVFPRLRREVSWTERDVAWADLLEPAGESVATERTDPEDPCLIIYTSGTTGRPKGAVHPHCGFPVKATQDMAHLFDVQQGDRLLWYSDLGWMMGPWAIMGSLCLGATCVLFEGTPDHPHPGRIWELVERHRVTVLGIAPTAIRALMGHGDEWPAKYDLSSLRILGASGEPWNEGPWRWFLERIGGGRCPIINYSGGTEISGGILGCVSIRPLKPCSFNAVVPGMAADVYDEHGQPVRAQVGELVLTNAWPGMTRGFWHDDQRYLETYWSRWPGVWVHGDWALRDADDHWYILGRSDDTIKVAGKRLGPAEAESAACSHPSVKEAAAIGVPDALKGDALVVFAVLQPGIPESESLRAEIREQVAAAIGKALKPQQVLFTADIPKTRNGKVLRRLIRATYLGSAPGDTSSLENTGALDAIRAAG
ncbi:MAG: AMP-dependent synthetase and ligase [Armatimonadetes bacterium]|nr:AMP-dependent synthetase and ligase [Armatimonadota bacterium]